MTDFTIAAKGTLLLEFRCNTPEATKYVQTSPTIQWWQPTKDGFVIWGPDFNEAKTRIEAADLTIAGFQ